MLLVVASGLIFMDVPSPDASDAEILRYYADWTNQTKLATGFLLTTVAALLFLRFRITLAARIRQAEGEPGWLSRIALVSGGAFVTAAFVGSALSQFVRDAVHDPDRFTLDPDVARACSPTPRTRSIPSWRCRCPPHSCSPRRSSLVALRAGLLPRWVG